MSTQGAVVEVVVRVVVVQRPSKDEVESGQSLRSWFGLTLAPTVEACRGRFPLCTIDAKHALLLISVLCKRRLYFGPCAPGPHLSPPSLPSPLPRPSCLGPSSTLQCTIFCSLLLQDMLVHTFDRSERGTRRRLGVHMHMHAAQEMSCGNSPNRLLRFGGYGPVIIHFLSHDSIRNYSLLQYDGCWVRDASRAEQDADFHLLRGRAELVIVLHRQAHRKTHTQPLIPPHLTIH